MDLTSLNKTVTSADVSNIQLTNYFRVSRRLHVLRSIQLRGVRRRLYVFGIQNTCRQSFTGITSGWYGPCRLSCSIVLDSDKISHRICITSIYGYVASCQKSLLILTTVRMFCWTRCSIRFTWNFTHWLT